MRHRADGPKDGVHLTGAPVGFRSGNGRVVIEPFDELAREHAPARALGMTAGMRMCASPASSRLKKACYGVDTDKQAGDDDPWGAGLGLDGGYTLPNALFSRR